MAKKNIFTDAFGTPYFLKRLVIFILGIVSYRRFNGFNKLKITGTEHLVDLPDSNVLFVCNHQTYFADVAAMYHAFCAVNNGYLNTIKNPIYLLNPKIDFYYVAAEETMNKGILPKIFKIAGAVTVKRTWRAEGKNVNRMVDMSEVDNIMKALDNGWVATFPQGTTSAFAQGRRGTAKLVKNQRPIVIPIKTQYAQKYKTHAKTGLFQVPCGGLVHELVQKHHLNGTKKVKITSTNNLHLRSAKSTSHPSLQKSEYY